MRQYRTNSSLEPDGPLFRSGLSRSGTEVPGCSQIPRPGPMPPKQALCLIPPVRPIQDKIVRRPRGFLACPKCSLRARENQAHLFQTTTFTLPNSHHNFTPAKQCYRRGRLVPPRRPGDSPTFRLLSEPARHS